MKDVRKREYILVKKGTHFMYARMSHTAPDTYIVMAEVTEREGRVLVERANEQSEVNKEIDTWLMNLGLQKR